ncbi:hypothetical protein IFR05_004564 [Cadophora sp. M221]|nr:hypothetical protein IFR05_004564 [Cadophora sp. M221]
MTDIDSKTYLANGGYLQKGVKVNILEQDLGNEVQDLLPSRWFRDEKIFQLERRAIFSRYWHIASFVAKFEKTGDYLTMEMFGWPFFLIKDKNGEINAFHNVCRHRGHPITTKQSSSAAVLTCRFHGWTYLPNGSLHTAREYTDLTSFDPSTHSLFKIHTHITAQGFIFVNFDASPTPSITFTSQFGDDFDPCPPSPAGKVIGNEYALLPTPSEWTYDHTWHSSSIGTNYNWKTFADGFQECYHCATGHPSTLPRDFALNEYYLRQGHGASRHFLPARPEKAEELGESYITWLYPAGSIIFSGSLLFIARFDARGALDTRYESQTYRRSGMGGEGEEHERWLREEVGYWRFVEKEDVELAVAAQRGFDGGVLGRGRLHPVQEHAIKWYQDKVRKTLLEHKEMEIKEGKIINYATPVEQGAFEDGDALCKLMGPEFEW